jgi:hypothetical protein
VSLLFQILSQICPRLTSHIENGVREGAFTYLIWGLVMGPAYPLNRKLVSELPLDEEHDTDEETSDSIMSLLEENARLRGLVVKLTDLILKNVADRG